MDEVGKWAFLIGVLLAILAGLLGGFGTAIPYTGLILLILGLVIGFLNITTHETSDFLLATIALIAVGTAGFTGAGLAVVGTVVAEILKSIVVLVSPAALVVGLKAVWAIGRK